VFARLKFESGVHRVQRVPSTESGGRIHTSAATVAVLPEAEDVDIHIDPGDIRIDTMRASGAGGQHVNTTDSAVRITHIPTGIVVTSSEKSQHRNREIAMNVLKARLFDLERQRAADERSADRRSQVGSGDRSERIRTYNFPQGRVTDHRINLTLYRLDSIMEGDLEFAAFTEERLRRRPVSQIIGWREFYGRRFRVTSDVLDPRPETETLIAAALEAPFARVLDLGTGTGCILLTLLAERPQAAGIGVDISPGALEVAKSNRDDLSIGSRAEFIQSDWYRDVEGRFDLIVANPPYIGAGEIPALAPEVRDWEPRLALVAGNGEDPLLAYRRIAAGARAHLLPGGRLMVETGAGQAAEVLQLFRQGALRVASSIPARRNGPAGPEKTVTIHHFRRKTRHRGARTAVFSSRA